jgi:hypothetical protein
MTLVRELIPLLVFVVAARIAIAVSFGYIAPFTVA